jgi:hypothetical protein
MINALFQNTSSIFLVWESWRFGIDSLTFESRLLALPQKLLKESNPPNSIPGFVPTLLITAKKTDHSANILVFWWDSQMAQIRAKKPALILKRIDSSTFESSFLTLSQKSPKEASLSESTPRIDPTLLVNEYTHFWTVFEVSLRGQSPRL